MDHAEAIRLSATERYLMGELSPEQRDQFEEHFFGCVECAQDVRVGSVFVDQTKLVLAEHRELVALPKPSETHVSGGWLSWFRPAFAMPVLAALIAVIGYQNLVTYPQLRATLDRPQVVPWTAIHTRTRGSSTGSVSARQGGFFLLFVTIPPDASYKRYFADLYDPAGKLDFSLPLSAEAVDEAIPIQVPTANHEAGNYALALRGVDATGQSKELSRNPFVLQIEN